MAAKVTKKNVKYGKSSWSENLKYMEPFFGLQEHDMFVLTIINYYILYNF